MRPVARLLATSLLLLGVCAGCGDPIENYCGELKDHRKELNEMVEAGGQYGLLTHLPMLRDLSEAAPDDLTDEWQSFLAPIEELQQVVKATGHEPNDFADGKTPTGLSAAQKAELSDAANALSSRESLEAASGIDQQARDVCKVNLGR